jgi:peptide/nickel transport system permease protein
MRFDLIVSPPSKQHYLGTDSFGRDILSRTIYGARVSLRVGFVAVILALSMGLPIGLLSGYMGGLTDAILMRLADALLAFPAILLAVAFIGILGPGETSVMLGLGIVYTPIFARVARAKILSIRELDYIKAAKSIGASDFRIICLHLLPNAIGPVIVQVTVAFAFAIIAEAGMSFLGLGTQPPTPSWGLMLAEARPYIQQSTWYPLVPGIVLTIVVLSVTIVGDRLREILDPHSN